MRDLDSFTTTDYQQRRGLLQWTGSPKTKSDHPLQRIRRFISNADSVSYQPVRKHGHSQTWCVIFSKEGQEINLFGKQFLNCDFSASDDLYAAERNPDRLFMQEQRNVKLINNNVSGNLVPWLVGSSVDFRILLFDYISTHSDRELLLKARELGDEEEKLKIIYGGARKIGIFNGSMQAQAGVFSSELPSNSDQTKVDRLVDYLLKIVAYDLKTKDNDVPESKEQLKRFVEEKYKLDLIAEITKIAAQKKAINGIYDLSHGDCRVDHVKGDVFVDLEQFGSHPRGYDLVTYTCAEGGISAPPLEELPNLLGVYLAYERDAKKKGKERKKALTTLDEKVRADLDAYRTLGKSIDMRSRAKFMVQFLALDLEETLHLDASNKRYSPKRRVELVQDIPNYNVEQMMMARLEHVQQNLKSVADNQLFINLLLNSSAINSYFSSWANLLQRLKLADVDQSTLERISG